MIPAKKDAKVMDKELDRLSEAQISAARPKDKLYKLYDGGGLSFHINPSGGKWWRFNYRFGRKQKTLALGTYPLVSLKDARRSRDAAKELLSKDIDPSEMRKQEKAQSKAEYLQGPGLPHVRISFGGNIEIWKGGNVLRLTLDEARFIANLLTSIMR
jgi:hypothetical protein